MKMAPNHTTGRFFGRLALFAGAALLAACGGGNPGTTGTATGTTGTTGTTTGNTAAAPALALTLVDGAGVAVTTLSGGQSALLRAVVTTAAGKPAVNAIVSFAATSKDLVEFTPASASALTDASGVAVISVKPASLTSAGALAISATSVVDNVSATGSRNMAVGAAPLTVGALAFSPAPSGALPAFSTITLNIPVTSGGQPATGVTGLSVTSLCVGDGKALLVLGTLSNGVQSATYTNNGCLRENDVITASIGSSANQISLPVLAANLGTVRYTGSSVSGSAIVLKGSGGLGRSESAQLTFRVVDQLDKGLAGVNVSFQATTTTGGLTVSPANGTTDANGDVSTTVTSGTIPTPVRVVAQASRGGQTLSGLSDGLIISTGLPIQRFMSMSVDKYNIEGWGYDNEVAKVTVLMADQYGNPVSDNTNINFVTEGGAVGSSAQGACVTVNGGCTVDLRSQNFRPDNGRVTVLAYAQGLKDFVDLNGDGQYSCADFTSVGSASAAYRPLVDKCNAGGEPFTPMGDAFLDTGVHGAIARGGQTLDGVYDAAKGDMPFPYNHPVYTSADSGAWGITYIRQSAEVIFSGSEPTLVRQQCDATGVCRDWAATDGDPAVIVGVGGTGCKSQTLTFRMFDLHNNPMPAGTVLLSVDSDKLAPQTFSPNLVPSTNAIGGTIHSVSIKPDDACAFGSFAVRVLTPKGTGTLFRFTAQ